MCHNIMRLLKHKQDSGVFQKENGEKGFLYLAGLAQCHGDYSLSNVSRTVS